jgi:hypothetical protein
MSLALTMKTTTPVPCPASLHPISRTSRIGPSPLPSGSGDKLLGNVVVLGRILRAMKCPDVTILARMQKRVKMAGGVGARPEAAQRERPRPHPQSYITRSNVDGRASTMPALATKFRTVPK